MAQFGAATVIGPGTRLILADCFETLVALGSAGYRARRGVPAFLDHFTMRLRIPLSVVSDAAAVAVEEALSQAGLRGAVRRIWHAGDAVVERAGGRRLKDLARVLDGEGAMAAHAVFIGDSQLDAEAARLAHVPFIRVPRSEDADFSFAALIQGPSRYASGHFSQALIRSLVPQDHR